MVYFYLLYIFEYLLHLLSLSGIFLSTVSAALPLCPPDCGKNCPSVTSCPKGYSIGYSYCNCCKACLKLLGLGEPCGSRGIDIPPPLTMCKFPLMCRNGICRTDL